VKVGFELEHALSIDLVLMDVCQQHQLSTSLFTTIVHVEMLSFRDFDAWLENSRGRPLKHSLPTIDRSKVSAVVKVKPKTVRLSI
jgi:hypothetical protein